MYMIRVSETSPKLIHMTEYVLFQVIFFFTTKAMN